MFLRARQQIAICVLAVVMLGGFVLLRYLPLRAEMKSVKQTRAEQMLAAGKAQAESRQLPVLEEQLHNLQLSVGDCRVKIPQQRDLGAFLRRIADLMNANDLRDQVVAPGAEIEAEKLNCIPVNMQCRGRLAQIFEFYRQLEDLDRFVRIEQVKLTNDTSFSGRVTMETRAVIYYGADFEQG